ncbi:MAG: protein kinase [archaeon]|nr:protein kinase [archaeon]
MVYKVKRLVDDNIYALKKVKLLNLSDKEKLNSLNEVRILASVKSNFVISYKEAFFDEKDNTLGIVMEFADNGDLYQKIVEHKKAAMFFEESDIWRIFIQLVKGLKALHDLKILHRDLKSANVFLEKNGCAKLGDLNVSKVAKKGLGYTQTGTPYYASPEVWKDQPYNNKSDIWSLGCVLYEMITLRPPFRAENMEGLYNKVIKGNFSKIPERFSSDLQTILNALLKVQPEARPSCDQILKMPIIQKRIEYFKSYSSEDISEDQSLLQTIRMPKNILFLSDKLPKPNYESSQAKSSKNYRSFSNGVDLEKKKIEEVTENDKTHSVINEEPKEEVQENKEDNKEDKIKEEKEKEKSRQESRKIIRNKSGSNNISLILNGKKGTKLRDLSPRNRRIIVSKDIYPGVLQIKNEYPQLHVPNISRKMELLNKGISLRKVPKPIMPKRSANDQLKDLYKMYAPYLNGPSYKKSIAYGIGRGRGRNESPDVRYYHNLEKYLDEKYNGYSNHSNHSRNLQGPEIKIIPKRKLSPIKRHLIDMN